MAKKQRVITEMKAANEAAGLKYSAHLKLYAMFLESKEYKRLFKTH